MTQFRVGPPLLQLTQFVASCGTSAPTPSCLADIVEHAIAEFPDECCGYVRGAGSVADEVVRCRNAQADGEHPTHPERGPETGFVIAGRELFEFARAFDTDRPPLVVYHSHTNGRAYLSEVDRVNLAYPVHQLVVGIAAGEVTELALFAPDGAEVARLSLRC